jgi:hypothetical protein
MFGLIASLASGAIGLIKGKQELKQAILTNKIRLAASQSEYNHEWEMAQLQDSDKWLRRASFVIVFTPLIVNTFYPPWANHIFQSMNTLPPWYEQTIFYITAAIWGIHALKNPLATIVSSFKK